MKEKNIKEKTQQKKKMGLTTKIFLALQLFHKLRVDHLGFTLFALALELVAGKIFGQRGGVPALICYDAHKISPFHRKS